MQSGFDSIRGNGRTGAAPVRLVDLGQAAHINVDAGYGPWPAGRELVDRLIAKVRSFAEPLRNPAAATDPVANQDKETNNGAPV